MSHPNVARQSRVEGTNQIVAAHRVVDRHAGHLTRRMHARVRASSRDDWRVTADDRCQLVFEDRLHADRVGLSLPAGVSRAVVGKGELEGSHDIADRPID
jgi:hypothetical protein